MHHMDWIIATDSSGQVQMPDAILELSGTFASFDRI